MKNHVRSNLTTVIRLNRKLTYQMCLGKVKLNHLVANANPTTPTNRNNLSSQDDMCTAFVAPVTAISSFETNEFCCFFVLADLLPILRAGFFWSTLILLGAFECFLLRTSPFSCFSFCDPFSLDFASFSFFFMSPFSWPKFLSALISDPFFCD